MTSHLPRRVVALLTLAALATACSGGSEPGAGSAEPRLRALVVGFVAHLPGEGTNAMTIPTARERRVFTDAVLATASGELPRARRLLRPLEYSVVPATTERGRVWVLRERADAAQPHGWGLVVLDPGGGALVVEVPHPVYDRNTPSAGVTAFEAGGAQALLVAGTHRYANDDGSSDVAHDARTMFAAVDRVLAVHGRTVLQVHGYDASSHDSGDSSSGAVPAEDEVVVSSGSAPPRPPVPAVASALADADVRACVYDGTACSDLGATDNVEGAWCRRSGAGFVHLEMSDVVRDDPTLLARVAAVAARAAARGTARATG